MSWLRALILAAALVTVGCGDKIGDACSLSTECSPRGDRICIDANNGGYCTIMGCDHDTCPEEAICVRFYSIAQTDQDCVQEEEDISTDDCTPDELCTLAGFCVPRTSEVRFCMLACGGQDDCRAEFECRDQDLMIAHGGEPVPPPGESVLDNLQSFCAPAPR